MRVFVTGGTGLVGRRVVARLRDRGDQPVVLSRRTGDVTGDPTVPGPWLDELAKCDAVVHLAGEPIAGHRWTTAFRQKVRDSRVHSTRLIAETLAKSSGPRVLVSASAVGYYGMFEDNATEFVETDLPGSGFLADVCLAWERATEPAAKAGVRVSMVRVGFVLAGDGGALPTLARPFRWFLGGPVAGGRHWVSWIHVDDLTGLFLLALDNPNAAGPINGTAPEPVTNWGFSQTLAAVLNRPCRLRVPKFALQALMGSMSELATHGQRVIPQKAKTLGYEFQYPLLEPALRDVVGETTEHTEE
jgi:uncharacterized protein (TIGR01777 family)